MAVRPAPNPSDNVNAPLNACLWDRRAARRHARTVHPARSVPPAVPTPTAPVYCAPSPRSSAATAAALLTAGPHRLASPPGSLLCSSSAAPFPLGDGVVGTTHSQAGREPPLPIQISTFGGTLPCSGWIVGCCYSNHHYCGNFARVALFSRGPIPQPVPVLSWKVPVRSCRHRRLVERTVPGRAI